MKNVLCFLTTVCSLILYTSAACAINTLNSRSAFGAPIVAKALVTSPPAHAATYAMASAHGTHPLTRSVVLMNIPLNNTQKRMLQTFSTNTAIAPSSDITISNASLPSRIILGMNNVPVLDQGLHGTCVTFAETAALDALIGEGDHFSQLCALELGQYLEKNSYLPSGWEGTRGDFVLSRFSEYGLVSKAREAAEGCGGLTSYPSNDPDNAGNAMSLEEYAALSENFNNDFYWYALLTPEMFFADAEAGIKQDDMLLKNVKKILATKGAKQSTRVTFAAILPINHCNVGACATFHQTEDTWALTASIKKDYKVEFGGHQMVITGYDDYATAIDNEGKKHQGLLYLRNSWGDQVGDHGDFYMTYEFFKHYALSVEVVKRYE